MRAIKLKVYDSVVKCPECGNRVYFNVHSLQVGDDSCNVWVECGVCDFDPTAKNTSHRFEDVFGDTGDGNCLMALECWNDAITSGGDDQ